MTAAEALLIKETREWMAALAVGDLPSVGDSPTLRFTLVIGPGPRPSYTLMTFEDPENETDPGLDSFATLAEAIEGMKETVRLLTHHGWRFVFNFQEC
jgi:hypothetical protein